MPFVPIAEAIDEIRAGRMLIVVDDEDRENEGDLTIAAEKVTPEIINFMATHGRGLIFLTLTPERCDALRLPLMTARNTSNFGTAFTESIDAREGVTTGISAADRTVTIRKALDPACKPSDLARPGHVFPLRAHGGGVLARAGQTEASVDLARLAGLNPSGVICEIMNPDGTMARVPQLVEFCRHHSFKMASVADLIRYRLKTERSVRRVAEGCVETDFGVFKTIAYASEINPEYHLALVRGEVSGRERVLVRMHSRCVYGNAFGSTACECGPMLRSSMKTIAEAGEGVIVYLHENSPGFRIEPGSQGMARIVSHSPDSQSLQHEHGIGAQILSDLGLHTIRLLTNHPRRVVALEGFGIEILDQLPVAINRP
jgi:3,4-dihydroxy 2-butanone 4-phosphate synthase/GTP cyclohydrolase II